MALTAYCTPPDLALALADLLEELGDPRAAGLRGVIRCEWSPRKHHDGSHGWRGLYRQHYDRSHIHRQPFDIPDQEFDGDPVEVYGLLEGWHEVGWCGRYYHTRSDAFFALAAALIAE